MLVIYPAIIHVDDDGLWAEFPDLPGCFTQGDTQEELLANAEEAMECFCWDCWRMAKSCLRLLLPKHQIDRT